MNITDVDQDKPAQRRSILLQYRESIRIIKASSTAEQGRNDEIEHDLGSLKEQHYQQIQGLQQIIQSQTSQLRK